MKYIVFCLGLFFFVSCKDKKDNPSHDPVKEPTEKPVTTPEAESIVGKWKVVDVEVEGVTQEEKDQLIGKMTVDLGADGSYDAKGPGGNKIGTYKYDDKTKTMITIREGKPNDTVLIEFRDKKLVITRELGSMVLERTN